MAAVNYDGENYFIWCGAKSVTIRYEQISASDAAPTDGREPRKRTSDSGATAGRADDRRGDTKDDASN